MMHLIKLNLIYLWQFITAYVHLGSVRLANRLGRQMADYHAQIGSDSNRSAHVRRHMRKFLPSPNTDQIFWRECTFLRNNRAQMIFCCPRGALPVEESTCHTTGTTADCYGSVAFKLVGYVQIERSISLRTNQRKVKAIEQWVVLISLGVNCNPGEICLRASDQNQERASPVNCWMAGHREQNESCLSWRLLRVLKSSPCSPLSDLGCFSKHERPRIIETVQLSTWFRVDSGELFVWYRKCCSRRLVFVIIIA